MVKKQEELWLGDLPVIGCGEVSHWSALVSNLRNCCYAGFDAHGAGIEDAREVSTGDLPNTSQLFTKCKFVVEGGLCSGRFDCLFFLSARRSMEGEY